MRTILSLCDYSGNWSQPYRENGYHILQIDLKTEQDVRLLKHLSYRIYGILAAPPCTEFALSGNQHWGRKGRKALIEGLSIVDACLRAVVLYNPHFWVLENPMGRLKDYLGPPVYSFNPCDFGDPYKKKTLLWGKFNLPIKEPVEPILGSLMHRMWSTDKEEKSNTPMGFSYAFFKANL